MHHGSLPHDNTCQWKARESEMLKRNRTLAHSRKHSHNPRSPWLRLTADRKGRRAEATSKDYRMSIFAADILINNGNRFKNGRAHAHAIHWNAHLAERISAEVVLTLNWCWIVSLFWSHTHLQSLKHRQIFLYAPLARMPRGKLFGVPPLFCWLDSSTLIHCDQQFSTNAVDPAERKWWGKTRRPRVVRLGHSDPLAAIQWQLVHFDLKFTVHP